MCAEPEDDSANPAMTISQNYHLVLSLDEAVRLLATHGARARVIAGATDLLIELERKQRTGIDVLIDLTKVSGLDSIVLAADGWIHLGPLVTHNDACASALIQARALPLAQACWEVGAPQIRNRATVAGNLITASPANDTITPLIALGAVLRLRSLARGDRQVALEDFYTGVRRTVMEADELLVDIAFPAMKPNECGVFIKLGLRRAQAISIANVAIMLCMSGATEQASRSVSNVRVALGSVAPTIVRARLTEASLENKVLSDEAIDAACELAQASVTPISDIRAPADYRLAMVGTLVRRALEAIRNDDVRRTLPTAPVLLATITQESHTQHLRSYGSQEIEMTINGQSRIFSIVHHKTLLRMLREDADLQGTKEGCAEGECGACCVILNGKAVMSCLVPARAAKDSVIQTVEGLSNHPIHAKMQKAFVDEAAVQCGYCTPGFLMAGAMLLDERAIIDRDAAEQAFAGNLCRCTGYFKILDAVVRTAERRSSDGLAGVADRGVNE